MKKITLLFLFAGAPLFAQVTVFTDAAAFDAAYEGTMTFEDFSGASADEPNICGNVISADSNDCFPAGTLESGFEISTVNESAVVYLPAGFLPSNNASPRVGANDGADGTVISFTGTDAVFAAGHSLHVDNSGDFNYKVINNDDEVIYDEDREYSDFVGVIATEPIKRIEITALLDMGDLIGDLQFGTQGTMDTPQHKLANIKCYPNPAGDIMKITSDKTITNIALINILGQTIRSQTNTSQSTFFDLSSVSPGNYFARITVENGDVQTVRIMKK